MLIPSISELQPYFSALAALLSVATLALVVNIAKLMSDAAKARAEALEERLKGAQDDLQRTEKWNERRVLELTNEVTVYKTQLSASLSEAGINLPTLLLGKSTQDLADELNDEVRQTITNMLGTLDQLHQANRSPQLDDPAWHLELAKGLMATKQWLDAAFHFDKYIPYDSSNWEIQFSRAIAYANSRGGEFANLSALRAISEAINLSGMDKKVDNNRRARMFSYRSTAFKRLGRLDEAEADLTIAEKLADSNYEILDIKYNRACVYAMRCSSHDLI